MFCGNWNGTFDANPEQTTMVTAICVSTSHGRSRLSVADYFTPCDQATMFHNRSRSWFERASSAARLRRLCLAAATNDGRRKECALSMWLNRENLGRYNPPCPDSAARVQVVPVGDVSILSTPLF